MPSFLSRFQLAFWLLIFAALGLSLVARVPVAKAPDEAAHWEYVQHLATLHALPVFRNYIPPAPGYEFHQPPLYYLLCAPLWAATGAGVQNYACRLVSLLCGLLTLVFIWRAARVLFPDDIRIAHLATGFAALWPLLLGTSASSNNDALGALVCVALFERIALLFRRPLDDAIWRHALWIGVWAGIGALSKNTVLVVSMAAFGALLFGVRQERSSGEAVRALGVAIGAMLLLSGWWLWRNQMLYGDPLAYGVFSSAADAGTPGMVQFAQFGIATPLLYWRGLLLVLFATCWGIFGGSESARAQLKPLAPLPQWPDVPLLFLMLVCVLATLLMLAGSVKLGRKYLQREKTSRDDVWLWWSVGVALVFAAWLMFAIGHFSGAQARYLLPALLPLCVIGARAWIEIWRTPRAIWVSAVVFALTLLTLDVWNVVVWRTLV